MLHQLANIETQALTQLDFFLQYRTMLIILLLSTLVLTQSTCPDRIADEIELISQPLQCFQQLYNYKQFDGHRIIRAVNDRIQTYQRILQQISMSDQQHITTTPVFKWAQNMNQIFISFKLSHRQDSPTCSDLRSQSFSTTQIQQTFGDISYQSFKNHSAISSSFSFKGECFFTTQKFLFAFSLQFQGLLRKLTLRKQGLGLYTLIGDKKQPGIWIQPFNDYKKAAIWSQLRQKYAPDMDKFFLTVQQLAQSSQSKGKRRPRKRSKKDDQNQL